MPLFSFVSGRLLPTPAISRLFPGMATAGSNPVSFPRRLVILAFCFDTSSRIYALFEDTHRPFQGSYAPHLYAVALAFTLQTFLEVWWIKNLGRPSSTQQAADEEEAVFVNNEKPQAVSTIKRGEVAQPLLEEVTTAEFLPLYIVGSLCQGSWAMSWVSRNYSLCRLFLTISAVTQLYAIFSLLNGSKNRGLPKRNRDIHLITKSRAALAMMLLWKTWGTTDTIHPPTPTQQVNNLSFLLIFAMSSGPDPTMGLCLTYVLFSLALGPYTPTYYVPITPLESAPPEPSSRAEAILHQVKARISIGVRDGGWHDTFAWSAFIVFLVVIVDWLLARHARSRRAAVRLASQSQAMNSFVFPSANGTQAQPTRRPPVYEDSDEEDEEEEWINDEAEYEDGSEEYEMRGGLVRDGEGQQERSGGPQEDVLLLDYHKSFDLPDQPKQPGRPNFVLVVDPPTPNRGATGTPPVEQNVLLHLAG